MKIVLLSFLRTKNKVPTIYLSLTTFLWGEKKKCNMFKTKTTLQYQMISEPNKKSAIIMQFVTLIEEGTHIMQNLLYSFFRFFV
jgi:hypothetical protein